MPWLFTDADWNHWPPPLLVLWCERAQSQLLNVKLNYHAVWRLHGGREPKLTALLESYSSRWGSFWVNVHSDMNPGTAVTPLVQGLLTHPHPFLHTLQLLWDRVSNPAIGRIALVLPIFLPSLRVLHVEGVQPIFLGPTTSVAEIRCALLFPSDWSHWAISSKD